MKTEVACTACGAAYLVDRAMLDGSGAVPCPACGQQMLRVLRQPSPEPDPGSASEPAAETPGPQPAATSPPAAGPVMHPVARGAAQAVARVPDPPPEAEREPPVPSSTVAAGGEEVVCPRCGLHFQPRPRPARTAEGGRKTVLVVEDNPYFIEIAQEALGERFNVRNARTFDEAWSALASGGIDLLVLDLTLDKGEGGRALLQQLGIKPCPILIFTARDESEMYGEEWDELRALGADDMVLKGMNVGETLTRKACELLDVDYDENGLA